MDNKDVSDTELSLLHYNDVMMSTIVSRITSLTIVYSTVYADTDQRKYQSYASLAFVGMVNSPHKWPVTRKMFPFDDVIMTSIGAIITIIIIIISSSIINILPMIIIIIVTIIMIIVIITIIIIIISTIITIIIIIVVVVINNSMANSKAYLVISPYRRWGMVINSNVLSGDIHER